MRVARLSLFLSLALASSFAFAAEPFVVKPGDLHIDALRPSKQTYVVYMHGAPGTGFSRVLLASSEVKREGKDWVIEQHWEGDAGVAHTARTVHSGKDLSTLSQTTMWKRANAEFTTTVDPKQGTGKIQGTMPDAARAKAEAGFKTMQDGWWMNWHSDLALLPLLPYEKGGTLRIHLFDVGMEAPMDVDYIVAGDRKLQGGDGRTYDCWLVETESGSPGQGNWQRFWIDKATRTVIKEEDAFNGTHRSKILLSVPAVLEFP